MRRVLASTVCVPSFVFSYSIRYCACSASARHTTAGNHCRTFTHPVSTSQSKTPAHDTLHGRPDPCPQAVPRQYRLRRRASSNAAEAPRAVSVTKHAVFFAPVAEMNVDVDKIAGLTDSSFLFFNGFSTGKHLAMLRGLIYVVALSLWSAASALDLSACSPSSGWYHYSSAGGRRLVHRHLTVLRGGAFGEEDPLSLQE